MNYLIKYLIEINFKNKIQTCWTKIENFNKDKWVKYSITWEEQKQQIKWLLKLLLSFRKKKKYWWDISSIYISYTDVIFKSCFSSIVKKNPHKYSSLDMILPLITMIISNFQGQIEETEHRWSMTYDVRSHLYRFTIIVLTWSSKTDKNNIDNYSCRVLFICIMTFDWILFQISIFKGLSLSFIFNCFSREWILIYMKFRLMIRGFELINTWIGRWNKIILAQYWFYFDVL
jgi:hypothetical protein